ncbi:MAG: hypothetical protein GY749_23975 [Desulfobacteraceae bacterium]|nr:hypothetical protein [Desulfobacteraceae bacterium]
MKKGVDMGNKARSFLVTKNQIAVSALSMEEQINVFQNLDTVIDTDKGTMLDLEHKTEDNKDEMSGTEEPTGTYYLGRTGKIDLTINKVRPAGIGFILAYLFGSNSVSPLGTGYRHIFRPIDGRVDESRSNPSFTVAQIHDEIIKRRFASAFFSSLTLTFAKGEWLKGSASAATTGKVERNLVKETQNLDRAVTEITLGSSVEGATEDDRVKSIHKILAKSPEGAYFPVPINAVSSANPAVVTVEPVGETGTEYEYHIYLIPTENMKTETVSGLDNVSSVTLGEAVAGTTALERAANVLSVREDSTGDWKPVTFSAVSAADPGVVSITSLGGDGDPVNYQIRYRPENGTWHTFPAKDYEEAPLKVKQTNVHIGGKWDGTKFVGGMNPKCELKSVEWGFNQTITLEDCFGADELYAATASRDERSQTLKVDREFRDAVYEMWLEEEIKFGVSVKCEGMPYDEDGNKYALWIVLPKVGIEAASKGADGNKGSESIQFKVLEDETHGSVVFMLQTDNVAEYAKGF